MSYSKKSLSFGLVALAVMLSLGTPQRSYAGDENSEWSAGSLWNGPFFNGPNQGFQISVQTPDGIPQHSTQSAKITGTISLVGVKFNLDDHDDDSHGYKHGLTLLERLVSKGYRVQAYWPDLTTQVSPDQVSLSSSDGKTIQFRFDTPALQSSDLNLFTLQVMLPSDGLAKMQKIQAKFDRRIVAINALIAKLSAKPKTDPKDITSLKRLRDKLLAASAGMGGWLAQRPDVLAEARFPLQVDNKVATSSLSSTVMGKFRLQIAYDIGSAIEGKKTTVHGKVTNLRVPNWVDFFDMDLNPAEKEDQGESPHRWVTRFYWGSSLLKEFSAQTIAEGQSVLFDFDTDKLEPEDSNTFLIKHYSWHDKMGQVGSLGSVFTHLSLKLPVANDNTAPTVLAGATPDAPHSCVYDMQPVSISLLDTFGLIDPTTIQASLRGTLNDGTLVGGDVTSRVSAVSPDQGQNYLLTDSGALNPPAEGVYTFSTKSQDLAKNFTLPNPYSATFRVNRTPPLITLGAQSGNLDNGVYYTNQASYAFNVSVTDFFDLCTVFTSVTRNSLEVQTDGSPAFTAGLILDDGLNLLAVSSTNQAGNSSSVSLVPVVLDTAPPVLSQLSPVNGSVVTLLNFPVSGKSDEILSSIQLNGKTLNLAADRKSFSGFYEGQTEGPLSLQWVATDLAGNVNTQNAQIQILLRALNADLLSVVPDPDGRHLIIKGAPGATRPGLTVSASSTFLNAGSAVGAVNGSFSIRLFAFSSATVSATDPLLGRTDSATVSWGGTNTLLSGVVKDTDGQLLRNVTVSLGGTGITPVMTDASGVFVFQQPTSGDQILVVDGSTAVIPDMPDHPRQYGKTSISISIGLTQSNVLQRPIYLAPLRLDGSATQITNGQSAVVTDIHAPGVEIKVPGISGSVLFPDGSHAGQISMATVSAEVATIRPMDFASPTKVVALEPSGLKFSEPVQLTLPNDNELPAGVQVVIMSMNSKTGAWGIDGAAEVSADGTSVVTKEGMGITHFSMVYAAPIGPTVRQIGGADQPGADTFNGALTASINLPSYKSLGRDITPSLLYKSSWAKPTALITNLFDIPRHEVSLNRDDSFHSVLSVPICIGICVGHEDVDVYVDSSVRGSAWYEPDFITAQFFTAGITGEELTFKGVPNRAQISYATDLRDPQTGDYLSSGIYPYFSKWRVHLKQMIVGTRTVTRWNSVETAPQITQTSLDETRLIEQAFPADLGGPLFVDNQIHSAAGKGWKIAGIQKISNPADDRVMIEEGDGTLSSFAVSNTLTTLYSGADQGVDLSKGSDISQWPNAYVYNPSSGQVLKKDLTTTTNPASLGGMFGVSGRVAGAFAFNIDPDLKERDNYSSCNSYNETYSYAATPGQFALLPNGDVLGSDSGRHLMFRVSGGGTSLLAGSLSGPPASFNPSPGVAVYCKYHDGICIRDNAPGGQPLNVDAIRNQWAGFTHDYCGTLGATCHGINVGVFNVGFGQCPFSADFSSGSIITPGNSGTSTSLSGLLNRPMGVSPGPRPNTVVVADMGNNRVLLVDLNSGSMTTIAGNSMNIDTGDGGPATSAGIMHPKGVIYDAIGNLYISTESGLIRKVDINGVITTFAGTKEGAQLAGSTAALKVSLVNPYGMTVDNQNGYLYVADTDHNRVVRIDFLTRTATQVAGNNSSGDSVNGQSALAGGVFHPTHLGLDPELNLLIVDSGNNKIKRVTFQNTSSGVVAFASLTSRRPGVRKDSNGNWVPALVKNSIGTWTRNYRNGSQVFFNASGLQTGTLDRVGNVSSLGYDAQGRLVNMTDATGRSIVYTYSGNFLSTIRDPGHPNAPATHFSYDSGSGNLTSVTYPDGSTQSFSYRVDGLMASQRDVNGVATRYTYNEWNRLIGTTHDIGIGIGVADSGSATVGNPFSDGAIGTLHPVGTEAGGVQDAIQDPNGHSISVSKDSRGYVGATVDASGLETKIVRNEDGNPVKISRGDGTVQTLSYDDTYGDLIWQSDTATGVTRSQSFDEYGNPVSSVNGRGYQKTVQYDSVGLIIAKIDPLGQASPAGHQSTFTYNSAGQVLTVTNPVGFDTLTYNSNGDLLSASDSVGHTTTSTHDAAGNVLTSKDAKNQVTSYEYDFFNRLIAVTSPKGERTEYTYRLSGELSQIKDALGNLASFEYDSLGRMIKKTDALGMVTLQSFDKNGNIIQETDPNGNIKQYTYNSENLLILKTLPDNVASFTYDSRKNMMVASDNVSQIEFTYDQGGRLTGSLSRGVGALSGLPSVSLSFGRDANGNRTNLIDPFKQTTYQYDELDRLTEVRVATGGGGGSRNFGFGYDNGSRLVSIARPGSQTALTFDSANFLKSITHLSGGTSISSYSLTRDAVGNVTQVANSSLIKTMGYDENGQITSMTNPEVGGRLSETFSYDQIYNRKEDQDGRFNFEVKSQRMVSDYKYFYFYDNNGNLRSKQAIGLTGEVTNYFYSSENQLTEIRVYQANPESFDPSNLWSPSTSIIKQVHYSYDVLGRRIQKGVIDHTAVGNPAKTFTRRYAYDGQDILLEYDGENQLLAHHAHSTLGPDDVLATDVTEAGVNQKLAQNTGMYTYLKDSFGSVVDVSDTAGQRIQHYVYSAFGVLLGVQDAMAQDITPNPVLSPSYSFAGREWDGESGLYYNRARYLDPNTGRFLQKDASPGKLNVPLSTVNAYIYAHNSPHNYRDPSGNSIFGTLVAVIGLGTLALAIVSGLVGAVSNYNSFKNNDAPGYKKFFSVVLGAAVSFGVTALSGAAAAPTLGLAGIPLAAAGAMFNNFGNQLIFNGPSGIDFGRVINAGVEAGVAQAAATGFGALFGGAPGAMAAFVLSGINSTCVDSGITPNNQQVQPSSSYCAAVTLHF